MSRPVVIVTGASRGIGQSIVQKLLKTANVIGVSRSEQPLKALADENTNFKYVAGDITNESVTQQAIDLAISEYKRLDGIVFNAGVLEPVSRLADAKSSEWKQLYDANFFTQVSTLAQAIPHLRESKGKVVFVSSGAAKSPYLGWGAYGSSKAASNHLAATLAAEEPELFSIAVEPGVVDTGMQTAIRNNHKEAMGANHSKFIDLKESSSLLAPETPAAVVANLVLKGDQQLTGKTFRFSATELDSYRE